MGNEVQEPKNICVFGIGGVGGYFGWRLAQYVSAKTEGDKKVFFIARGRHLEEISRNGLTINTVTGETQLAKPSAAADNISLIPKPDVVLLCVKGYDLDDAVVQIAGNIKDNTIILPLLNGVDVYERIRRILDRGIVLPACVYVSSYLEEPGTVTVKSKGGRIVFGKDPEFPEFIPEGLMRLLDDSGIRYSWEENPARAIWEKYAFITTFALVTAYSGKGMGEVISDPELRGLAGGILNEAVSIAGGEGVKLNRDAITGSAAGLSADSKTSFQRDIERRSTRNEGDLLAGTLIRLGKKHGIPTPVTDSLYADILERLK